MPKTSKDYMEAADAVVPNLSSEEAVARYNQGGDALFIDVRDSADIEKSGTIKDGKRLPRGLMEFAADPETALYRDYLTPEKEIYLICGAGGQAALAGKTLKDMGFSNVTNIGGFPGWKEAGGPTEEG
ncbi:MAG: rhodanese-like domain-containing protein [Paracoccaceae bacterium]